MAALSRPASLPAGRQPAHAGQAAGGGAADVRLRLCAGADLPRHLRGAGHQRAVARPSSAAAMRRPAARQHAGRPDAHDHGGVRRQCPRPLGLQARQGLGRRASGRTRHGDVRVPQHAGPHHGRAGDSQLCAEAGDGALQQARVLLLQRVHAQAGRGQAVAGGLRHRPEAAQGRARRSPCPIPSSRSAARRPPRRPAACCARRRPSPSRSPGCERAARWSRGRGKPAGVVRCRPSARWPGPSSACASSADHAQDMQSSTRCT